MVGQETINTLFFEKDSVLPSIVFIHGWMDSMSDFTVNINGLRGAYNIYNFDLPGHGNSTFLPKYSIEEYIKKTTQIIDRVKNQKVILIGHSFGALIATELYKKYPEKFKKVILVGPPLGKLPRVLKVLLPILMVSNNIGLLQRFAELLRSSNWFRNYWATTFVGKENEKTHQSRLDSAWGMQHTDIKAITQGVLDTLDNKMIADPPIKDPKIYLIYGQFDPVIKKKNISKFFLNGNVFEIMNERHTPNRTSPFVFNKVINEIIRN